MKPTWKRLVPQSLVFLLVASSPLNVLSTTALASSLDKSSENTEVVETIDPTTPPEELIHLPQGEVPTIILDPSSPDNSETPLEDEVVNVEPEEEPIVTEPIEPPTDAEQPSAPIEETPTEEEQPADDLEEPEVVVPLTDDERFVVAKETMESAEDYTSKRKLVNDAVNLFKKEQSKDNLQLALDYTVLLPYDSNPIYKGDKYYFADIVGSLFEFIQNEKEKETLHYHFAKHSLKQTELTLNHNDLGIARLAHSLLPEGEKKNANAKELKKISDKVYAKHSNPDSGYVNWDDPTLEFGDVNDGGSDNWEPGFNPDGHFTDSPDGSGGSGNFQEGYTVINFNYEGNSCYKNTVQYGTDGNVIKRSKELATDAEKAFCVSQVPPGNANEHFGEGWTKTTLNGLTGAPDSIGTQTPNDEEKVDKVDEKSITIQYTFDKDSNSPYYQDTGIEVSEDQTITYQQARDALYQITISDRSKFVEDVGKSLGLLDGHIILVEDQKKPIPIKEFISLFDETSIGIKAQSTRSGDTYELIDLIEIKELENVLINGETFAFASPPIVDDEAVLFPVEQFATELGADVITEKSQTVVIWKNNKIVFKDGSSTARGNGEVVKLKSTTRQSNDGIRMVDIYALLTLLDAEIEIDAFSNEVAITTK